MHGTVRNFVQQRLGPAEVRGKRVLEIGSRSVNGTVRPFIEALGCESYIGVDTEAGDGVDYILSAHQGGTEFAGACDLILCLETLEHCENWQESLAGVMDACKVGGRVIVTTRGPDFPFHCPPDYWRATPAMLREVFASWDIDALEPDVEYPGVMICAIRLPESGNGLAAYCVEPLPAFVAPGPVLGPRCPSVTVIIPTQGMGRDLTEVLGCWARQTDKHFHLHVVLDKYGHVSRTINEAWRTLDCRGTIVYFCGDDIKPSPDFIRQLRYAFAEPIGRIGSDGLLDGATVDVAQFSMRGGSRDNWPNGWTLTTWAATERVFARVCEDGSLLDERFTGAGWRMDTDLGWRIENVPGINCFRTAQPMVFHMGEAHTKLDPDCERVLESKHPEKYKQRFGNIDLVKDEVCAEYVRQYAIGLRQEALNEAG